MKDSPDWPWEIWRKFDRVTMKKFDRATMRKFRRVTVTRPSDRDKFRWSDRDKFRPSDHEKFWKSDRKCFHQVTACSMHPRPMWHDDELNFGMRFPDVHFYSKQTPFLIMSSASRSAPTRGFRCLRLCDAMWRPGRGLGSSLVEPLLVDRPGSSLDIGVRGGQSEGRMHGTKPESLIMLHISHLT